MDIFKIIAVGILTTICTIVMKQFKPELAIFVTIAGSIVMIFLILSEIGPIIEDYKAILAKTNINSNIFSCVLKVIGIGYLAEFASGICVDAGVNSIAQKILLAGKVLILIVCLPVINNLIEIILDLIP